MEIEPEMNNFVCNFGGRLVSEMLETKSPTISNADYWFEAENIVVELKCLTKDKSDDSRPRDSLELKFNDLINSGTWPDPGPGSFRVNSTDFPIETQHELYALFARTIRKRLSKANAQIKATRDWLNRPEAYGLVLLANDGNFQLEFNQLMAAVDEALGKNFSAIEGLVVFSENMLISLPEHLATHAISHARPWIPASREGHRDLPADFLRRFHQGWANHTGKLLGQEIPILSQIGHDVLNQSRIDRRVSTTILKNASREPSSPR